MSSERFESLTEAEAEALIGGTVPPNTIKKCEWMISTFKEWHEFKKQTWAMNGGPSIMVIKDIEEFNKADLNFLLKLFILEVRTKRNERYSAGTLKDFFSMIQYQMRHVYGKEWCLWTDAEFAESRRSLDAAMKLSTADGKGVGLKKSEPVSKPIEDDCWKEGVFGSERPDQMVRTVIWQIGKHFGLRGGSELRDLEFEREINLEGAGVDECLVYTESKRTKTNQGGLKGVQKQPKVVRAFHTADPEKCIVCLYLKYVSLRPANCAPALFLSANKVWTPTNGKAWFSVQPIGKNTLASLVKDAVSEVRPNNSGRFTNQSLRKACATQLHEAGVERGDIARVTGHSTAKALEQYIAQSTTRQKIQSAILSGDRGVGPAVVKHGNGVTVCETEMQLTVKTAQPSGSKRMRIEANGENNIVTITFDK